MDIRSLRSQLVDTAHRIVASGAISMSGHGNISVRVPDRDEILYTTAGTLHGFSEESIARLGVDGTVLEGQVPPVAAMVIAMHTAVYRERPETGCVLHTHSPFATAFAVANRRIEGWTEAFGIFGLQDGVPVAAYGPRGSELAVRNIRSVMTAKTQAVLLANHGILCWHATPMEAVQVNVIVEEAAQAAIYAGTIGGARVVPAELLHASGDSMAEHVSAGTLHS